MEEQKVNTRPPFWKRNYLVSRKFQLKYVFIVVVSFLVVIVLMLLNVHKLLKTLLPCVEMMDMGPQIAKSEMFLLIQILIIMAVLGLAMVYLTFRVAGPLFRIEKEIRDMLDKKEYNRQLKIRKGDEMQEIVVLINELLVKAHGEKK